MISWFSLLPLHALISLWLLQQDSRRVPAFAACAALLLAVSTCLAWSLSTWLLNPLGATHLQLILFLPMLATLAWIAPRLLARIVPHWPVSGLWLALILNGSALNAMLEAPRHLSFASVLQIALLGALGFWLALLLLADLQKRLTRCKVPAAFQGAPVMLICAGFMGLALTGLDGIGRL